MRKTISSIHVVLCTVLGLGLVHRAASRDHCLLSKGTVTTKILEIEIAEQAPESAIEGPSLEDLSDQAFSPGNVPQSLSDLFCPLAAAAEEFQLDRVSRLRGSERVPSGFLPKAERCAVVSNSGVLLNYKYGREIDAADLVFRFNDAEVGGSVRDNVGTRDDVRVLNRMLGDSVSDAAFNFTDGTKYLLIRHREAELQPWLAKAAAHQGQVLVGTGKAEEIAAEILHSSPFDIATRMLPGGSGDYGNPTTGFLGLLLAMSMCDEVHAYGFAQTKAARHSPFHYYGSLKEVSGSQQFIHVGNHPLESVEKQVFARFDNTHVAKSDKFVIPGYGQLSFC
mmetsp:Transcript_53913/g.125977  ORF Transcript_53913/g.125977 Transcript_53913/m.125977 type:complete len:337 (+) Transcript_53913:44-1054(+)